MAEKTLDPLARYWAKRDFGITGEPRGELFKDREGALLTIASRNNAKARRASAVQLSTSI